MPTEIDSIVSKLLQPTELERAVLDAAAIDAARCLQEMRAASTRDGPRRRDILRMLNDALATELVCALRYKRHYFTAAALASLRAAEDFLAQANAAAAHADRLAQRIVQLGGRPDFSPDALTRHSRAPYDDSADLKSMIEADLMAERGAIESYARFVAQIGDRDWATRRLLEDIVAEEQVHVGELKDRLAD
jgi:bacterioferritin